MTVRLRWQFLYHEYPPEFVQNCIELFLQAFPLLTVFSRVDVESKSNSNGNAFVETVMLYLLGFSQQSAFEHVC